MGFSTLPSGPNGTIGVSDPNAIPVLLAGYVAQVLLFLVLPLLVIGVLWTGARLITNSGKPEEVARAKRTFGYMLSGVVIVLLSGIIVQAVTRGLT